LGLYGLLWALWTCVGASHPHRGINKSNLILSGSRASSTPLLSCIKEDREEVETQGECDILFLEKSVLTSTNHGEGSNRPQFCSSVTVLGRYLGEEG
jgi:hypothetical protein